MIDEPGKTSLLMAMMKEALPIPAIITPYLAGALGKNSPNIAVPSRCNVIEVTYSGDPGGIICRLDIDGPETKSAFLVSLTHLAFDRRGPLAREIEAYQRHRIKKLKRQQDRGY